MRNKRPVRIILAVLAVLALVAAGMSAVQMYRTPDDSGEWEPAVPTTTAPVPGTEAASTPILQLIHG